uniref:Myosin motor domain-containing protein n=1 Tax=Rhabditophanes sp. KR3021 TaxID=114890 RepID=A0AC35U2X7_9BILA
MNIAKFRPAKIFSYTQHIAVQKQIQMYKDMSSVYQTTESGEVKRKIENEGDIEFVKSVSNMSDKDLSHYNKVVLSLAAVVDQNGNHQALNAMLLIEVLAF